MTIALATVFVLGLAASAFAIHAEIPAETTAAFAKGTTAITIGGNIRTRYEWLENADFNDDTADHWTRWDNRIRLNITAQVADTTTGYMSLENFYIMGDNGEGAVGIYTPGNNRPPGTNSPGEDEFSMLEGWINHSFGPVGLKIGHMPLALGNKLFFDHTLKGDDAAVIYANPTDQIHVAGLFIKFTEGNLALNDDADAYVGLVTYTGDAFSIGGNLTWVNDNVAAGSQFDDFAGITLVDESLDLYNFGVHGTVNAGPAVIKFDGEFQSGQIEAIEPVTDTAVDTDFGGYALMAGADIKLGAANVGAELAQGSGQDLDDTSGDTDIFVTTHNGRVPYVAYVYDTRVPGACGVLGGGICNTTYGKVTGGASLTDAVSLNGALIYLMATEENAVGEDELGIELDAVLAYQLARNLKVSGEFGYFDAGDWYGPNVDAAYAVRGIMELSF